MSAIDLWNQMFKKFRLGPVYSTGPSAPPAHEGTCLKVPLRLQIDLFSCGVVAGWTVIQSVFPRRNLFKSFIDFDRFYKACNPDPDNGTPITALVRALRSEGVCVSVRKKCLPFFSAPRDDTARAGCGNRAKSNFLL